MASACVRNMTLGQNLHVMPQNCVLITSQNCLSQNTSGNQFITQSMGKTPIAPAPTPNSSKGNLVQTSILGMNGVNVQQTDGPRYKKKYTYTNVPYGEQPPSVARRNARERNRVKQVNNGFANLRQHIPQNIITALTNGGRGASKKLSKVDTLRLAVEYIRRLQDLLDETDGDLGGKNMMSSQNSTSTSSSYYPGSPEQFSTQTHSTDSSPSPTPSFNSDVSIGNNNYIQSTTGQFKFESYDNYGTMRSEDEELLDYISSWQDQ